MSILNKLMLYYHTAKNLRFSQIIRRFEKSLSNLIFPVNKKRYVVDDLEEILSEKEITFSPSYIIARNDTDKCMEVADSILENRFCFLNEEIEFRDDIEWDIKGVSRLWQFNLQYFKYAVSLGVAFYTSGEDKYYEKFRRIIMDWIEKNYDIEGDAWHPYCISRRVVNWIMAISLFSKAIDERSNFYKKILKSLHLQLTFLEKNLEYDVMANHLISDSRALFVGGMFFQERKWVSRALYLIRRECDKQILSDGGHYELSPMYHSIVLLDMLDYLAFLPPYSWSYKRIKGKVMLMLEYLNSILPPNGELPLFADTSRDGYIRPEQVFSTARELEIFPDKSGESSRNIELSRSGYYIMKNSENFIIIDGGKFGSDEQPGHGHCDLLSYELLINGNEVVVDSGNYDYENGEMRRYCRSTEAHNTVRIDSMEQSEIWSTFRVGRKARPRKCMLNKGNGISIFTGSYSPYKKPLLVHKRWIGRFHENCFLVVDRIFSGKEDSKKHRIENFIHLHPDITVKRESVNNFILKGNEEQEYNLFIINSNAEVNKGWYCPEFGKKLQNQVIKMDNEEILPVFQGYIIMPGTSDEVDIQFDINRISRVKVRINGRKYSIRITQ